MVNYRALKRMALVLGALAGCLCGFVGLMVSAGAALMWGDAEPVFTLSEEIEAISLPCTVEGTDLVACQLVMYEGPYLETGADVPVSDITALVMYNAGQQEIAQAEVQITAGEELVFFASNILPGARVLVLEKNASPWKSRTVTGCTGWVGLEESPSLPENTLVFETVDMGTIAVTNTSGESLRDIWLYYKNYLSDGDLYICGITYIETIKMLEPGQRVLINPPHYASGYSRIIKARAVS